MSSLFALVALVEALIEAKESKKKTRKSQLGKHNEWSKQLAQPSRSSLQIQPASRPTYNRQNLNLTSKQQQSYDTFLGNILAQFLQKPSLSNRILHPCV